MSCFIVTHRNIDYVLSMLDTMYMRNEPYYARSDINRILKREDSCCISNNELTKLGKDFIALNEEAYHQRYGDDIDKNNIDSYVYKHISDTNIYQALKSLKCLIYQCSEGDVLDMKLYKTMKELSNFLKDVIVYESEEYEQAEWGLYEYAESMT